MKLVFFGVGIVLILAITVVPGHAQAPSTVKVIGCLQGDGSEQKPWFISGVALPQPAPAAAAGGGGGGRGDGGGGGGRGGGGAAGAPAAGAAAPAAGAGGGAPAAQGGARGGAGAGGAGARGGGGRGGGGAAPPPPPAPVQLVDLRLAGGMDMSTWRGMKIEVEGTLGAKPATGLQEINITSARSVQGTCLPK